MSNLTVEKFQKDAGSRLSLRLVAGRQGMTRVIRSSHIQKPGLALTGLSPIDTSRVQVLGEKEMVYLGSLSDSDFEVRLGRLFSPELPCIIITRNLEIPPIMLQLADSQQVPVFRTSFDSAELIRNMSQYFEEAFTRVGTVHGVLVDVFGLGILIIGASGVGKSESALDLISRGHRLVADDVVDYSIGADQVVMGSGSAIIKHHMEVRGLGIINIREIFGIAAVRDNIRINVVVELVDWDQRREYDRLGLDERHYHFMDVPVTLLQIPVSAGRNLTTIIEVAARNHLLKAQGVHSVEELHKRLSWAMGAEQAVAGGQFEGDEDV